MFYINSAVEEGAVLEYRGERESHCTWRLSGNIHFTVEEGAVMEYGGERVIVPGDCQVI